MIIMMVMIGIDLYETLHIKLYSSKKIETVKVGSIKTYFLNVTSCFFF